MFGTRGHAVKPVWRKTIAVLEAVGGVCGFVTVTYHLVRTRPGSADLALMAVLLAVYMLALYAGVMLWRDTRRGRVASVVAQLIQLPKVVSPQLAFMVSYGLDFAPMRMESPGPAGWGLVLHTRFASDQLLLVNAGLGPSGFGLSVVSLLSLWLLLRPTARVVEGAAGPPGPSGRDTGEHPEWIVPFWLKAVAVVAFLITASCASLCLVSRLR